MFVSYPVLSLLHPRAIPWHGWNILASLQHLKNIWILVIGIYLSQSLVFPHICAIFPRRPLIGPLLWITLQENMWAPVPMGTPLQDFLGFCMLLPMKTCDINPLLPPELVPGLGCFWPYQIVTGCPL